jgi:hypothetical protein
MGPVAAALSLALSAAGQDAFEERVRPVLAKYCYGCHSQEKPKGDLRLDLLSHDFTVDSARKLWRMVLERVTAGEMPPKDKPRPSGPEAEALADWIRSREEARRAAQGRVVLRRLNRVESENTVRDLLSIDIDLQDLLPPDTPAHGFDNVGEALHTSSFLMERYLEAADSALNVAIANRPRPPLLKKRYLLKDERAHAPASLPAAAEAGKDP